MAEDKFGRDMDGIENILLNNSNNSGALDNNGEFKFDRLRMYFGEDYTTQCGIVIHQPKIQDILDLGEDVVYGAAMPFISNTTSYRLMLWDIGIDWNEISDFELFIMLCKGIDVEGSKLLFGEDINWAALIPMVDDSLLDLESLIEEGDTPEDIEKKLQKNLYKRIVLCNEDASFRFGYMDYIEISHYLQEVFNIHPKIEHARGKSTKSAMIWEERMKAQQNSDKDNNSKSSTLLPMISFCLNHPGFKYKKDELRDVCLVEFMDSVQRLNVYESTSALMKGMYSGFMDTSKIDKEQFNFMRELATA